MHNTQLHAEHLARSIKTRIGFKPLKRISLMLNKVDGEKSREWRSFCFAPRDWWSEEFFCDRYNNDDLDEHEKLAEASTITWMITKNAVRYQEGLLDWCAAHGELPLNMPTDWLLRLPKWCTHIDMRSSTAHQVHHYDVGEPMAFTGVQVMLSHEPDDSVSLVLTFHTSWESEAREPIARYFPIGKEVSLEQLEKSIAREILESDEDLDDEDVARFAYRVIFALVMLVARGADTVGSYREARMNRIDSKEHGRYYSIQSPQEVNWVEVAAPHDIAEEDWQKLEVVVDYEDDFVYPRLVFIV